MELKNIAVHGDPHGTSMFLSGVRGTGRTRVQYVCRYNPQTFHLVGDVVVRAVLPISQMLRGRHARFRFDSTLHIEESAEAREAFAALIEHARGLQEAAQNALKRYSERSIAMLLSWRGTDMVDVLTDCRPLLETLVADGSTLNASRAADVLKRLDSILDSLRESEQPD